MTDTNPPHDRPGGHDHDDVPPTPDPLTMAVRAEVLGEKPNSMVRAVLERQAQLIKSDVTHRNWQIAREAAGAALMILAAISAFTAVIIVAGVLWSATQYRGLTILPFSVPPVLEERGLTGAAVASRVLDRLAEMQTATQSMRAGKHLCGQLGRRSGGGDSANRSIGGRALALPEIMAGRGNPHYRGAG